MHGEILNGWLVYVIIGFVYLSLAGALAVTVDTLRRPRRDFGRLGKAVWLVVQPLYLIGGVITLVADMGITYSTVVGGLFLIALVQQVAYLLRVVFPSPARVAAKDALIAEESRVAEVREDGHRPDLGE